MNYISAEETARMHILIRAFVIFMKKMHFLLTSNALFQNWHHLISIFQIVSKSYWGADLQKAIAIQLSSTLTELF